MSRKKLAGIILAVLVLCLGTVLAAELRGYDKLKIDSADKIQQINAEISECESELAAVNDDKALEYLEEAEKADMRATALRKRIPALKADAEAKNSKLAELQEEKLYYSEIYNELLKGKEKVEGYLAAGN